MNTIRTPSELMLLIRDTLSAQPECHVPNDTIRICWELSLVNDSKWRRYAIAAFAEENGWEVEHLD
jgi:hypothetical protein